jgi:hypothetical protein
MLLRRLVAGIAVLLCLNEPARGAMYTIDNPASNIYNPATRMNNPNPLSPPIQPVPQPPVKDVTTTKTAEPRPAKQIKEQPKPKPIFHKKRYYSKTVRAYITAAKKAFDKDDYKEFVSITEEALKRINAGTLKASKTEKQRLVKYKIFGYGLLEKNEN